MKKYKICPLCSTHNPPDLFECVSCEADLTSVRVTDEEKSEESSRNTANRTPKIIRICDCGEKNAVSARKCSKCGEDISDIVPVEDRCGSTTFTLCSDDGECIFEVPQEKTVIGRENVLKEYLCKFCYVSRNHAEISFSDGRLYVKNLSRSNGTYINNVRTDDELHELKDGDLLSLGGCTVNGKRQSEAVYFEVRMKNCT